MRFLDSVVILVNIYEIFYGVVAFIVIATVVSAIAYPIIKNRDKNRKILEIESAQKQAKLNEERIHKQNKLNEKRSDRLAREKEEQEKIKIKEIQNVRNIEKEKIAEEKEKAKKENERLTQLAEKRDKFYESSEYKLIKQFAKKYENRGNENELSNLQLLLKNQLWDFSTDELKEFIQNEYWGKLDDFIEKRVFVKKPSTFNEAIRIFLERCNPDDTDVMISFAYLLKNYGFDDLDAVGGEKILVGLLVSKVKKIEKEIELENFEKRLNEEDEQVWLEDIDQLDGYGFEDFLKNLFSKMNYQVEQTKLSGDQGADLVIVKFGEKTVIQAKRSSGKIGNRAVQEIMAAISLYKAQKGVVVTNNYFTSAALELADANNIELIDRDALEELINKYW